MIGRTYLLRGEPVRVIARWRGRGPRNVLLELPDGSRTVRPFRGLRRCQHTMALDRDVCTTCGLSRREIVETGS